MSEVTGRVTLTTPITIAMRGPQGEREETITEVTVRPLTVGDMRKTAKIENEELRGMALAAILTGLDDFALDKMAIEDFVAISKVIEGFTPPGLLTGGTAPA